VLIKIAIFLVAGGLGFVNGPLETFSAFDVKKKLDSFPIQIINLSEEPNSWSTIRCLMEPKRKKSGHADLGSRQDEERARLADMISFR
jgi:hypothetical protein